MKTTLDIPDPLLRQVKARAALRGVSLRKFVAEALEEKVCPSGSRHSAHAEPP
jgi:predicted DNA binding CopG/RHH family protein